MMEAILIGFLFGLGFFIANYVISLLITMVLKIIGRIYGSYLRCKLKSVMDEAKKNKPEDLHYGKDKNDNKIV